MLVYYIKSPQKLVAKIGHRKMDQMYTYVVDEGSKRIGVIVATDAGKIGWSLCNPQDKFDKSYAKLVAEARASGYSNFNELLEKAPTRIHKDLKKMYERSIKYFK